MAHHVVRLGRAGCFRFLGPIVPGMRHQFLFMVLWACVVSSVSAAQQQSAPDAMLNPSISSRRICLNQSVQITITTLKPQLAEADPASAILTSITLPTAQQNWRVVEIPKIEINDKINFLKATWTLAPRRHGLLPLPEIAVRWLSGNTVGRLGQVEVAEKVRMGSDELPLPKELNEVAGQPWGGLRAEIMKNVGGKESDIVLDEATKLDRLSPKPGLDLLFIRGRLSRARILASNLPLIKARSDFLGRWGDPIRETMVKGDVTSSTWILGWIRIEATALEQGTLLTLIHELTEDQQGRADVERDVFQKLDGPTKDDATPKKTTDESATEKPTQTPKKTDSGISPEDAAKEFERKLKNEQR